ncbi:type III secretion system export apparatus subunit SctR [Marinomonas mediterranea]|jgi:type III secretion apparatus protein, YscR/HrcR family|uniref:Yop virulence translocation R n=1 Tax=Marinomonas mediterranea (strain ATCC 700492 / JCM 21426 / NBRC 103028 / MMB-1) TaxID=717774 RepID=F2JTC8_MARM1|nr:type III secretion system export apparatus subunit SctR [Marinomonas mediterranea]ADZ90346.1 Yop virulence translocation R [Marinomonas mediterranea MMB-1]WCN08403.1 EscR/YscR/HrcR family type III secretion system export apparatus protein [Marinomonas mediterranea]WCN12458.1 EscR/YscR/HrcR family type III secretion system export apparatus protein [Marinomonas mediterranea]WCN16530.1 EscR/YscR/HrcR family type III secretion system export apparatus protein [Marinomonas mediterranea MMB-1]
MNLGNVDPMLFALFLGALSLLPIMLIVCSAFLKISMVLMITRNAMGVQQVPPNMAIYGIALAATMFVMAPVFSDIGNKVKETPPDFSSLEGMQTSANKIVGPLQAFMSRNSNPDVTTHMMDNTARLWPKEMASKVTKDDLMIVIPSFMLSELKAGLQIGFLIYIPFIVIDLIVSNLLLALGMQMVSPMTISLPLKILLFVLVDGWGRLLDGLFYTYI